MESFSEQLIRSGFQHGGLGFTGIIGVNTGGSAGGADGGREGLGVDARQCLPAPAASCCQRTSDVVDGPPRTVTR